MTKYIFLTITIIYTAGILWFSFFPDHSVPSAVFSWGKVVRNFLHIPAYTGLAGLLALTAIGFRVVKKDHLPLDVALWSFCVATLFGVLNEFIQATVPGRYFSVADMLRNA